MSKDLNPDTSDQTTGTATEMELRVKVAGIVGKWQAWLMPDGVVQVEPTDRDWPERMYKAERVDWSRALDCTDLWSVPDYPNDLNACADLIDMLADKGWVCRLDNGLDKTWECVFRSAKGHPMADLPEFYAPADKLATAICLAFIATMEGSSVEQEGNEVR